MYSFVIKLVDINVLSLYVHIYRYTWEEINKRNYQVQVAFIFRCIIFLHFCKTAKIKYMDPCNLSSACFQNALHWIATSNNSGWPAIFPRVHTPCLSISQHTFCSSSGAAPSLFLELLSLTSLSTLDPSSSSSSQSNLFISFLALITSCIDFNNLFNYILSVSLIRTKVPVS